MTPEREASLRSSAEWMTKGSPLRDVLEEIDALRAELDGVREVARIGELVKTIVEALPVRSRLALSMNPEGAFLADMPGRYASGRDAIAALEALVKP